jgi:hypothetical protein
MAMSALPPKADIAGRQPAECPLCANSGHLGPYSITLSALARRLGGMLSPSVLQFSPKSVQPMNFLCLTVVSDLPTSMTLIGKS